MISRGGTLSWINGIEREIKNWLSRLGLSKLLLQIADIDILYKIILKDKACY